MSQDSDPTATPVTGVKDTLFAEPLGRIGGFSFDKNVASVFPDMLTRSIPGYHTIIAQTGLLAGRYAAEDSNCYDLGCSLGATAYAMQQHIPHARARIVAVDTSRAMLDVCTERHTETSRLSPIEFVLADASAIEITGASVVALNFTLQFIDPVHREPLLNKIASGMRPGGALILSEKIRFADAEVQQLYTESYEQFKAANGYSQLEIAQKRTALENVLIPDTLTTHEQRLTNAGFQHVAVWFQCFNFMSLIAIR